MQGHLRHGPAGHSLLVWVVGNNQAKTMNAVLRARKPRVLVDLRPALAGFSGIPHEARLAFTMLLGLDGLDVAGLIHHGGRFLRVPKRSKRTEGPPILSLNEESQLIAAMMDERHRRLYRITQALPTLSYVASCLAARPAQVHDLRLGEFQDFIWQTLFRKSLLLEDFAAVTAARYAAIRPPWAVMAGVLASGMCPAPRVSANDYDYLLAHTPFPARLTGNTRLIVRYHDAVPILHPHTIANRVRHQRRHFTALFENRNSTFVCISEASRNDLLKLLPNAETYVVPNSVSNHFHATAPDLQEAIDIIRVRQTSTDHLPQKKTFNEEQYLRRFGNAAGYLLVVSSFEPRKNHRLVLSAWEALRQRHPGLKLVLVGSLQWDHHDLMRDLAPWIHRGEVAILSNVPGEQLRTLYASASCVVCPSVAEGFDYSGVEAMTSGGLVAASDIPVHREVFGDDVAYFNPYGWEQAVDAIDSLLEDAQHDRRARFRERGVQTAKRYNRAAVAQHWASLFEELERKRRSAPGCA